MALQYNQDMTASTPDITPNTQENPQPTAQEDSQPTAQKLAHGIFHCPVLFKILDEKREEVRPFLPKELELTPTKPINGQRLEDIKCTNCEKLVNSQIELLTNARKDGKSRSDLYFQGPEPFNGDPESAEILFLSSNPAVSLNDNVTVETNDPELIRQMGDNTRYPQLGSDAQTVHSYFVDRPKLRRYTDNDKFYRKEAVESAVPDGYIVPVPKKGMSQFARTVAKYSHWLNTGGHFSKAPVLPTSEDADLGEILIQSRAVISEVVHCKSVNEKEGSIPDAVRTCGPKWLVPLLKSMPKLKLIVVFGKPARETLESLLKDGQSELKFHQEEVEVAFDSFPEIEAIDKARRLLQHDSFVSMLEDGQLKNHIKELEIRLKDLKALSKETPNLRRALITGKATKTVLELKPLKIPIFFVAHPNGQGLTDNIRWAEIQVLKKAHGLQSS